MVNEEGERKVTKIQPLGENGGLKSNENPSSINTFAQAVSGNHSTEGVEKVMSSVMVLDEECLTKTDISKSLFYRVKVFASLANLKPAIGEEGFEEIKISYMGKSWVKLDFVSLESMKMFKENGSIGSWFSCIKQADKDFVIEGRVAWVEIEGIPFKFWSKNTFRKIANRWGDLIDFDDQEDNCYHSK
ncbi:nucleotide-binding alpha-beta plait domain-containing protein, partial [Tanacetum coccineum]